MSKTLAEPIDLAPEIERLEAVLEPRRVEFARAIAGGKAKSPAFIECFGYLDALQMQRLLNGDTGELIKLYRQSIGSISINGFKMDKDSRLEHILTAALQAHHVYLKSGEAAHLAQYFKGMTIINSMCGDNAPTEVRHMHTVTHEQLVTMSHSERTEAYKSMMTGKLKLIADEGQSDSNHSLIEGELVPAEGGGDTLGPSQES